MAAQLLALITILWEKTTVDLSRNKDTLEILEIWSQILLETHTCASKMMFSLCLDNSLLLEGQLSFMPNKTIWVKKETSNL